MQCHWPNREWDKMEVPDFGIGDPGVFDYKAAFEQRCREKGLR